jgi:hypothetical protein
MRKGVTGSFSCSTRAFSDPAADQTQCCYWLAESAVSAPAVNNANDMQGGGDLVCRQRGRCRWQRGL